MDEVGEVNAMERYGMRETRNVIEKDVIIY